MIRDATPPMGAVFDAGVVVVIVVVVVVVYRPEKRLE